MINLNDRRQEIIDVATEAFEIITGLPKNIRQDEKERTGIQVLVIQPGTRNLVYVSIKEPSEAAKFFAAEKAVRANILSDVSSGNSENLESMQFSGCISVFVDELVEGMPDKMLQASVSGLNSEEDVTIAVLILAKLLKVKPYDICKNIISNFGRLPNFFYEDANQESHYLWQTPGLLLYNKDSSRR